MRRLFALVGFLLAAIVMAVSPAHASENITYQYDALGRLVAVSTAGTAPTSGQNVTTSFDPAGNRTNYTVNGVSGGGSTPSLSISGASANEGSPLNFTVTLSVAAATTVTVNYQTNNGTAFAPGRYAAASGTLTFAPGVVSQSISVATTADAAVNPNQTMTVTLSSPTGGATIATGTGTGTIIDTSSGGGGGSCAPIIPLSYSASSSYASYGYTGLSGNGAGMRDGVFNTLASMHGTNAGGNEWVQMDLGSTQAIGAVVVVPATANAPGGWGAINLNTAILQRSNDGVNWTSVATISGAVDDVQTIVPVNATARYLRVLKPNGWLGVGDFFASAGACGGGGGATAVLTIAAASANEGSPLSFTVTRSGTTTSAVSANWTTSDGSAVAPTNYTTSSGTVSFAANQTSATVTVPTIHDNVYTANLTMAVALSAPSVGASLGTPSSATGTIVNTDASTNAVLSIAAASANEGSPLSFTVTRSGTTTSAVSANWTTSDGSAVAQTNYTTSSGTVSFAANQTSATVTVPTIDDGVVTGNLTMTAALSGPSAGASIGSGSANGTIVNIDTAGGFSAAGSYGLTSDVYYIYLGEYGGTLEYHGYINGTMGSLTNSTIPGNYQITSVYTYSGGFYFEIDNTLNSAIPPNSGWTSITVPGLGTIPRSSMSYSTGTSSTGMGFASWFASNSGTIISGTVVIQ
jgi:hypothetical protein